ncbi:MAG: DUF4442 domain-containing protein [Flavobacteriales bacterium]|nr:DUF4442 domain-containing protein [Flavobacteriales bacterium]
MKRFNRSSVFSWFLITKLPIAWLSGLRVKSISDEKAEVSVRYGFWNKNPFNSMYFACQAMAGEMATGLLALGYVDNQSVKISLLVMDFNSTYKKKAIGNIDFVCDEGLKVKEAVEKAASADKPVLCVMNSHGYDEQGDCVSSFQITWTFKRKSKRS